MIKFVPSLKINGGRNIPVPKIVKRRARSSLFPPHIKSLISGVPSKSQVLPSSKLNYMGTSSRLPKIIFFLLNSPQLNPFALVLSI